MSTPRILAASGRPHVVVIGAGAFGGWTALHLRRKGARVTLLDAWGPGHSRSSSGDETRVIRGSYGPNAIYTRMVAESLPLWRLNEKRWKQQLFFPNGALWIAGENDSFERAAVKNLKAAGLPFDRLEHQDAVRRWPQMNFDGLSWVIHEKDAGFLLARRACEAVMRGLVQEKGEYRQESVSPGAIASGRMDSVTLADGSPLRADHFVFACGPWFGKLFPGVIGELITPTRQEVFYFGTPAGDARFNDTEFPTWVDNSPARFYGIPGNQWRGFKVAQDVPNETFDPTTVDRVVSAEGLTKMRAYVARRFPALKDAPLVESRVCQYEMSADGHLIIDRHPEAENVWLVGGGSGHGFKLSPAVGAAAAGMVLDGKPADKQFSLSRFDASQRRKQPGQRPRT